MTNKSAPPIPTKTERNSSVELYRIIATFAVMIAHFNGWMLEEEILDYSTWPNLFRTIVRAGSCICVNMFLIISGYYGVSLKLHSIWNLFVMLFFIYFPFQIVSFIYHQEFSWCLLFDSMLPFTNKGYYIQCYLALLIFSPLINCFIKNEGKGIVKWTIMFLLVEFWFDIIRNDTTLYFNNGYSAFHFILMYMLGRCLWIYREFFFNKNTLLYLIIYLGIVLLITVFKIFDISKCWAYSNPLVIVASFCSFIPFAKKTFYNSFINYVAKSTLPVFIMHTCGVMFGLLKMLDKYLFTHYNYLVFCLLAFILQLFVFAFCVIYDKIRLKLTFRFTEYCYNFLSLKLLCIVNR